MPHLIIGCEENEECRRAWSKENPERKGHKGAYVFEAAAPGKLEEKQLDAHRIFELDDASVTPRKMLCQGDLIYTFTRRGIFKDRFTASASLAQRLTPLESFHFSQIGAWLGPEDSRESFMEKEENGQKKEKKLTDLLKEILDNDDIHGSLTTEGEDLLVSVYREKYLKEAVESGFLLRFPKGKLAGLEPTTAPHLVEKEKMVTGEVLVYNQNVWHVQQNYLVGPRSPSFTRGNILSYALSGDGKVLLLANNRGDYKVMVDSREVIPREEGQNPHQVLRDHLLLPSEATSLAVCKEGENEYTLFFGLDEGEIRAYNLNLASTRQWEMRFTGSLSFLSLDEILNSGTLDNHIYDLQLLRDTLFFRLHREAYKLGVQEAKEGAQPQAGEKVEVNNIYSVFHRTTALAVHGL